MVELKFTQMYIRKDTLREIDIMATIKGVSMKDVVREGIELYKLKHRLSDRVIEFMRG